MRLRTKSNYYYSKKIDDYYYGLWTWLSLIHSIIDTFWMFLSLVRTHVIHLYGSFGTMKSKKNSIIERRNETKHIADAGVSDFILLRCHVLVNGIILNTKYSKIYRSVSLLWFPLFDNNEWWILVRLYTLMSFQWTLNKCQCDMHMK